MRPLHAIFVIPFLLTACSTTTSQASPASPAATPAKPTPAATADFGTSWPGVTARIESTDQAHGLAEDMAQATIEVEWTKGLKAGVLYPKKFVDTETKQEVPMDFQWDNGGNIKAGTYDILVEHDGRLRTGWLRNVRLQGADKLRVLVSMNACMIDLPLTEYGQVVVYPAGTYEDYEARGMLDSIPDEAAISWYDSENKGVAALAPAGKADLKIVHADGTVEWRRGYELPANAKLTKL